MTDIIEGIDWCEKNNIDIINCSFGAQIESDYLDPLSMAVNEASNKYGIVCVVASGNTGTNLVLSPGRAREALTVGAYDLNLEVCDFSAYNHEGKPDVELVVPLVIVGHAGVAVDHPCKEIDAVCRHPGGAQGADEAEFVGRKIAADAPDDAPVL